MIPPEQWKSLGWRHTAWELVRYYCSLRGEKQKRSWVSQLQKNQEVTLPNSPALPVPAADVTAFCDYLDIRGSLFQEAFSNLRTENEAISFCSQLGVEVGKTKTQSTDHHQASKALVGAVTAIATEACRSRGITLDPNPQTRCVWCIEQGLHVTARNLDGAIPSLANPTVIWEIKEYWGKTQGGSKMSDAVYECNLVGRELREFEERTSVQVAHIVFVDGQEQWSYRKSDLARFVDLLYQGIIDHLFIGREVEADWDRTLVELLNG